MLRGDAERKKWQLLMLKALDGVVVKINMGQLDLRFIHCLPVDSEAVVL